MSTSTIPGFSSAALLLSLSCAASAQDWHIAGNGGTNPANHFLGTTNNQPLEIRVNDLRALRLEPNAASPNIIGGHRQNRAWPGVVGGTIAGGGIITDPEGNPVPNEVFDNFGFVGGGAANRAGRPSFGQPETDAEAFATVGGGLNNEAGGPYATVGGGRTNEVTGVNGTIAGGQANTAGSSSVVGGGYSNDAQAIVTTIGGGAGNAVIGPYGTIGGGGWTTAGDESTANVVTDDHGTVGGGGNNRAGDGDGDPADASYSTVPGGLRNTAAGRLSFAAGHRAKANHAGTFVWADSSNADFTSSGNNQFLVRASGGVGIGTRTPQEQLHVAGNVKVDGSVKIPATTRHLSISPAAFVPKSSGTAYFINTSSFPAVHIRGTTAGQAVEFVAPVQLPHLARFVSIRAAVIDNDATGDIFVQALEARPNDGTASLGNLRTSGAPGATTLSSPAGGLVDNANYTYFVTAEWTVPSNPADIWLEAVFIEYTVTEPLP